MYDLLGIGIGLFVGICLITMIVPYVIYSLLLMKLLKDLGYEKPGLAWVPVYSWWILTDCIYGDAKTFKGLWFLKNKDFPIIIMKLATIIPIVVGLLGFIPVLGTILVTPLTLLINYNLIGGMYKKICELYGKESDPVTQIFVGIPRIPMFLETLYWGHIGITPNVDIHARNDEAEDYNAYYTQPTEEYTTVENNETTDSLWDE